MNPTTGERSIQTEASFGCCGLEPSLRLGSHEADSFAAVFKALSHPVRLQIVELLSRFGGEVCVCDIENQFELSQPTISHHLRILRKSGVIDCEKRGLWAYYFARHDTLFELGTFVQEIARQVAE